MPYKDREQQLAAQRRYYQEHRELQRTQVRDRRQLTRKYVIEVKTAAVCADCKIDYPHYVMQFDHVRGTKVLDIARLAREGNMAKLLEEIEKCDIVCANCHMHRTWTRSAGTKRQNSPIITS